MRVISSLTACLIGLASIVTATSTFAQSGLDNPVTAEVLDGWVLPDGRRMAGLRLRLAPGWKTYWRAPGDAGIPPQFDWAQARNVQDVTVSWPAPTVFSEHGMRSLGYLDDVVFPLTVTPRRQGDIVRLRGEMILGVCADVCLPYQLRIEGDLSVGQGKPVPEIVAALGELPYSAKEAGVSASVCRIAPTEDGISIQAQITLPHTGGTEIVVIEPGVPGLWVSETKTTRSGATLVARSEVIHVDGAAFAINRSDIRITVIGSDHSVDVKGCKAG